MARSHEANDLRKKAQTRENRADALDALRDTLKEADSVGETPLSGHFYEVRMSNSDRFKKVTAWLDIEDGEAFVSGISKLTQGHWRPETRNSHDASVDLSPRHFMSSEEYILHAGDQIGEAAMHERRKATQFRERAEVSEHRQ